MAMGMGMDLPLHSTKTQKNVSATELASSLSSQISGVRAAKIYRTPPASASVVSGQVGSTQYISLKARGINLEIDPQVQGGLAVCYGGSLRVESELEGIQYIESNEVLIFGSRRIWIGGPTWIALLMIFDHSVIAANAQDFIIVRQEKGYAADLGRRALLSLINYIDIFSNGQLVIPDSFGIDKLLVRHVSWLASSFQSERQHERRSRVNASEIPDFLQTITAEITKNCMAYPSLHTLAKRSGYSKRQLQHLFRTHYFTTPMQFIKRARLIAASERLRSPLASDTVQAIGQAYGWSHVSSFSAEFKREFGVSPSAVLRKAKQQDPSSKSATH